MKQSISREVEDNLKLKHVLKELALLLEEKQRKGIILKEEIKDKSAQMPLIGEQYLKKSPVDEVSQTRQLSLQYIPQEEERCKCPLFQRKKTPKIVGRCTRCRDKICRACKYVCSKCGAFVCSTCKVQCDECLYFCCANHSCFCGKVSAPKSMQRSEADEKSDSGKNQ